MSGDLFGWHRPALPAVAGLKLLEASPPAAWPVDRVAHWPGMIAGAMAFARCWDSHARESGWTELQLYGLHPRAPWANLAAMGAAFQIGLAGGSVIAVSAEAIAIVMRTGSRQRLYRRAPDPQAVLAWELAGPCSGKQE